MRRILEFLIATACCASAAAQTFEAAAIYTRTDGTGDVYTLKPFRFDFSGPRITIENFRLRDLITYAYEIKDDELLGEPRWADIDRYNVSAKASDGVSLNREATRPMMRALLADRFQVKAHQEMKEMPVYLMVVAKGGPKFRESAPGAQKLLTVESRGKGDVLTVTGGDMAQLVAQFSKGGNVDRRILDRTGLTGRYDYKLEWSDNTDAGDPAAVSVFTAFQEQLGLRLQPTRASVQVLIVDHAERPSGN